MIIIYEVINRLEKEVIKIKDDTINRDTVFNIIDVLKNRPNKEIYKYYFVETENLLA
ncbi:MAG: hypothetical protein LBP63_08750 [Prevotellaceae bacterium]|jgi:hypothetical protein|nr:hypothetical protein [Prevotellaceae bacterium]